MSSDPPISPVRAHPIARLWTWIASIVLTLVGAPVAFIIVLVLLQGPEFARTHPPVGAARSLNLPWLTPAIWLVCWLAAWSLHLYASRRRRMALAHAIVPAVAFGIFVILAFLAPPPPHS